MGKTTMGGALPAQYDCDIDADKVNVPTSYRNRRITTRIRMMIKSLNTASIELQVVSCWDLDAVF